MLTDQKVARSNQYKLLDKIRNEEFNQLEAGYGKGIRHETTYYLNPRVRFFYVELLERMVSPKFVSEEAKDAEYWLGFLVKQHSLFIDGATAAIKMVVEHSG